MLDILQRMRLYRQQNPNELTPKQFKDLEREISGPRTNVITDEYVDFYLWCKGLPSRQESFAKFLETRIPKDAKVLEVGCGRTGRLSRILSDKGFKISAIDPNLEVESKNNIHFIKGRFNYRDFDLSMYDYVIAQEPCDATEHIVRACIDQNKPFIIALCGTPHRLISGEMPKDVYKWYDYLVNIDSEKIRFRCFNLDPITITHILKSNF